MSLIQVSDVDKTYQRGKIPVPVLQQLSLDIEPGEFVIIMGPSGSGKSTLLNLIGGLDSPTGGSIHVGATCISTLSEKQLAQWRSTQVGFIFQSYHLMPMLNAYRNVELPLLLGKLSKPQRETRANAALEVVGLLERADHKPAELSGGQQQRVAIARAIVTNPELLICDEPTGDLDRENATEILQLLQTLNREHGKTIIMVTHDDEAASFATHMMRLDKGQFTAKVAH